MIVNTIAGTLYVILIENGKKKITSLEGHKKDNDVQIKVMHILETFLYFT